MGVNWKKGNKSCKMKYVSVKYRNYFARFQLKYYVLNDFNDEIYD